MAMEIVIGFHVVNQIFYSTIYSQVDYPLTAYQIAVGGFRGVTKRKSEAIRKDFTKTGNKH